MKFHVTDRISIGKGHVKLTLAAKSIAVRKKLACLVSKK